jgi:hypothetical protein
MRAYLGQIDHSGLRRFLPEDANPPEMVAQLAREWSSPSTAAVRAVLADEDAEALRRALRAGDHGEACSLLLDRVVEVLTLDRIRRASSRQPDESTFRIIARILFYPRHAP